MTHIKTLRATLNHTPMHTPTVFGHVVTLSKCSSSWIEDKHRSNHINILSIRTSLINFALNIKQEACYIWKIQALLSPRVNTIAPIVLEQTFMFFSAQKNILLPLNLPIATVWKSWNTWSLVLSALYQFWKFCLLMFISKQVMPLFDKYKELKSSINYQKLHVARLTRVVNSMQLSLLTWTKRWAKLFYHDLLRRIQWIYAKRHCNELILCIVVNIGIPSTKYWRCQNT